VSVDLGAIVTACASKAAALGFFDRVNTYEPKSAPGYGLTVAVWSDRLDPVQASGLDQTSARVVLNLRVYARMLQEPQDMIDPNMLAATSAVIGAFSGDFDLGVTGVREVDLLGMYGVPLSAQAGYINQDGTLYRVMTVTVPVVVNDAWGQVT
jgi:hypothetical protein